MTEETLFHEALNRPAGERAAFLDAACAGRPVLRAAVEALLAAHEASRNVLDATVDSEPGGSRTDATVDLAGAETRTASRSATQTGEVLAGRYTLVEKLGEGGMGEVWVAQQTEPVKRRVALKLIKSGMDSSSVLARFEQERQALALMDHPNIARVLDAGVTDGGQPFFVMELVNGLPLTRFCDEMKLTPRERLELFVPICQAVQHAHQKGVVHRDLKPANILVTVIDGKPVPKVIDFGVAKATGGSLTEEEFATHFGAVVGTLEYMSPEQAGYSGVDVDTRADVYSLGVILYELLTGLRPIDSKRLQKAGLVEMIRVIQEVEPARPSTRLSTEEALPSLAATRQTDPRKLMAILRGELDWLVMKCLEKERARRYESASDLAKDVQRYLADEPVEARPPSFGYRLWKALHRNRVAVAAGGAVAAALLLGLALALWQAVVATSAQAEECQAKNAAQKLAAEKGQLAEEKAQLALDESAAKNEALAASKRAAEATREKDAQLQRTRATLFTSQMERVGAVLERDPREAFVLLQDSEACPIELRDLAWGFARNASLRRDPGLVAPVALSRPAGQSLTSQWVLSPDGKWLALTRSMRTREGNATYTVTVAEFPSGKTRVDLPALAKSVSLVCFAPDGNRLAVVADGNPFRLGAEPMPVPGTVQWFDLTSGKEIVTMAGHTDQILALACSLDGQLLATGSKDGTARIWDAATGKELHTLKAHGKDVTAVQFYPDGKRLATGGKDHAIRLWDVTTGKLLTTWQAAPNPDPELTAYRKGDSRPVQPVEESIAHLDFSPDGSTLISASTNWLIEVRDVATGTVRATVRDAKMPITLLRFHRDGTSFFTHGHRYDDERVTRVLRWSTDSGQLMATLAVGPDRDQPQFCQARSLMVVFAPHAPVPWHLTDIDAPPYRARLLGEKVPVGPVGVLFSPDGGSVIASGGKLIFVWDTRTGKLRHTLRGHQGNVASLTLSPDGRTLASSCWVAPAEVRQNAPQEGVRLWDLATGEQQAWIPHERFIHSVAFSPDGVTLAMLSWSRVGEANIPKIDICDAKTRAYQFDLTPTETGFAFFGGMDSRLAFNPVDGTLVSVTSRALCIWDLSTRKLRRRILVGSDNSLGGTSCGGLAIHPDGKSIVTTTRVPSGRKDLTVWNLETGELIQRRRNAGEMNMTFSPDGRNLLTGSGKDVEIWDFATLQRRLTFPAHELLCHLGLAVSPDGRTLASVSIPAASAIRNLDQEAVLEVRLWDVGRPATKIILEGTAQVFSPDCRTLVESDSTHGILRFWDIATGTPLKTVDVTQKRIGLNFSPDGRYLLGSDMPMIAGNRPPQWPSGTRGSNLHEVVALVNVLDTQTYTIRQFEVGKGPIPNLCFSPDMKRLALMHDLTSGAAPNRVTASSLEIWNVAENRSERTIAFPGQTFRSTSVPVYRQDSQLLAVVGSVAAVGPLPLNQERCISVVDPTTGVVLATLREPEPASDPQSRYIRRPRFSEDGNRLILSHDTATGLARLWDWSSGQQAEEPLPIPPAAMGMSPDGRYEIQTLPIGREVIDRTVIPLEIVSHRRRQ